MQQAPVFLWTSRLRELDMKWCQRVYWLVVSHRLGVTHCISILQPDCDMWACIKNEWGLSQDISWASIDQVYTLLPVEILSSHSHLSPCMFNTCFKSMFNRPTCFKIDFKWKVIYLKLLTRLACAVFLLPLLPLKVCVYSLCFIQKWQSLPANVSHWNLHYKNRA